MFSRRKKKKKKRTSPQRRASRRSARPPRHIVRWVGLAVAALLVSGAGAYATIKALEAWPRFYEDVVLGQGWFDLREVKIDGPCRAVSRQELLRCTGLRPGQNLFTIDLSRVRRELKMIPYLESVAVEQVLPHFVRIQVKERTPVVRVRVYSHSHERIWYLDANGTVMPDRVHRYSSRDPFAHLKLPEIIGVNPADLRPGGKVTDAVVYRALDALNLYRQIGMSRVVGVRSVDVSQNGVLCLVLDDGTRVTLGLDNLKRQRGQQRLRDQQRLRELQHLQRQLLRLGLLYEIGRRNHKRLLQVDLSPANSCPSLWQPLYSSDGSSNPDSHS
jgi:cell division septal protein FtsQ